MRDPDSGEVVVGVDKMAQLLRSHWGRVFTASLGTSQQRAGQLSKVLDWVNKYPGCAPAFPMQEFTISAEHVANAVKFCKDSSPGPDGIPILGV